jgi:hypothetical protein
MVDSSRHLQGIEAAHVEHRRRTPHTVKLYIAGVIHFDPLGRAGLRRWLRRCFAVEGGPPAFVATEWDQNTFAEVRRQRAEFHDLAQGEWPHASPKALRILELSLGYEADTHVELFPDVEVLWLDEGRQTDPSRVQGYAKGRLEMYRSFLQGSWSPPGSLTLLRTLSHAARRRAEPDFVPGDRDSTFARLILDRIARGGATWAVAIVGANHASRARGSMRSLLEEEGCFCDVTIL